MILYSSTCGRFKQDVDNLVIADSIRDTYESTFHRRVGASEKRSWENSLSCMERIVRKSEAPDDCGVLIEYNLPNTSRRIDFIITGEDSSRRRNLVIVELKQWEKAESTEMDGVVTTSFGYRRRSVETLHPACQASGYRQFLTDFNEAVYAGSLSAYSCAYLHNYLPGSPEPLLDPVYAVYTDESPVFFRDDQQRITDFIAFHVGRGRGMEILYDLEHGRIRPSRKLADAVGSLFTGNAFFTLLDEQKVLFELLRSRAGSQTKQVALIRGGPGTGKSVLSFNLLYRLLKDRHNAVLSAPNAAFREVMKSRLRDAGLRRKDRDSHNRFVLDSIITGSGGFYGLGENTFDVIVVDEAHRLKDGRAYGYQGKDQVRDIISAGRYAVFFVDDYQSVRPEDIGSCDHILRTAREFGAEIIDRELEVQFRCSGMEGYINWLDHTLQIRDTANFDSWDTRAYTVEICSTPQELHEKITRINSGGQSARILAGYAWNWTKEGNSNGQIDDVVIEEHGFSMPWNSRNARSTWAIDASGLDQVGCIHTSQGLEFDYVGVIIGRDLRFDEREGVLYASWGDYKDSAGKKGLKDNPRQLTALVKNIYKTLLSRAIKGCFIYCCDKQLEAYVRSCMPDARTTPLKSTDTASYAADPERRS